MQRFASKGLATEAWYARGQLEPGTILTGLRPGSLEEDLMWRSQQKGQKNMMTWYCYLLSMHIWSFL